MAQMQTLTFPGSPDAMAGRVRGNHGSSNRKNGAAASTEAWLHQTLSLAAAELRTLKNDEAEETIASLIELCRIVKGEEFVILDLGRLTGRGAGDVDLHAVDALYAMVSRVCLRECSQAPEIASERSNYRTDLRVRLPQFQSEGGKQERKLEMVSAGSGRPPQSSGQ